MIRLKRIDFICKRKLLLLTLLAFSLSMFVAANVSAAMYWKDYNGPLEGGYMPDIAQQQDFDNDGDVDLHYCAPVAEANSLWWLDKAYDLGIFSKQLIEDNNDEVKLIGTWGTTIDDRASAGHLRYTMDPSAYCEFDFTGTYIAWIGAKAFNRGQAEVFIDNVSQGVVDQSDSGVLWQQVIYFKENLDPTQPHKIKIVPLDAPSKYIDVDAFLVDGYIGGDVNGDGKNDTLDLVQDLAVLMKTNVGHSGTTIEDEQAGIDAFLRKYDSELLLAKSLYEHTEYKPAFSFIEAEVERSQDVKLDLGFWKILSCDEVKKKISWQRVGAHSVTVAGVDSDNSLLAISDPDNDAAEGVAPGVVRPVPGGHTAHPLDPTVHNIEANASHDIYTIVPSASPGGLWALEDYPGWVNFPPSEWGQPTLTDWPLGFSPCNPSIIITEIEAAVIVSPTPPIIQTPPAGTAVPSGSWYAISWTWTSPKMVKFDLHYSLNDGTDWKPVRGGRTIVKNTEIVDAIGIPGDGGAEIYYWKVPLVANNKIKSRVKVTGYDASGVKFAEDISDKFTIEVVKVTDPNGGEPWEIGSQEYVTWKTNKTNKPVTSTKVFLTRNASDALPNWTQICSLPVNGGNPNPGSCAWTVIAGTGKCSVSKAACTTDSNCPTGQKCVRTDCKVKVELKNNGTTVGSDVSDKVFSIVPSP